MPLTVVQALRHERADLRAEVAVLRSALEDISDSSQNYQNRGDERDHQAFHDVIALANTALSATAGSKLLDAVREAVEAMETAQEFLRQSCGHSDCINEALAKLRQFTGKEPLP